MKSMLTKAKNHSKKMVVHLKRHHRKYLFGVICCGILALIGIHTASTISNTFANIEMGTGVSYNENANITYVDTEGNEFTGIGTITVSNGLNSITLLDRNLGAITNDITSTGSYGYHFQWGNNYGFDPFDGSIENNATYEKVNTSGFGPGHYYVGNIFRKLEFAGGANDDWAYPKNDNLRGGSGDSISNNRGFDVENNVVINATGRQGPCPTGYHIPSIGEWNKLLEYRVADYVKNGGNVELSGDNLQRFFTGDDLVTQFMSDLKIPFAGYRYDISAKVTATGDYSHIRLSSPYDTIALYCTLGTARTTTTSFLAMIAGAQYNRAIGFSVRCFKDVSNTANTPTCGIKYSTTGLTNQNVIATLTGCDEEIIETDLTYTFTGNGSYTFIFHNLVGNTGEATATVTWINKDKPNCNVKYSTTGWTNSTVTATLTGCDKTGITVLRPEGSWTYPFTRNGTFNFEFKDAFGNTGSTGASVSRIDTDKPECSIYYETQGETGHESTTARLTGCTEEVTITNNNGNLYYVLGYSGSFTFEFKDRANNTGIAVASINMPKYTIQIKNGNEMLSLYNEHKAISCEYNYRSGTYSEQILMFAKNGKIYEYSAFSDYDDNNEYGTFYTKVLVKDNKIYGWGTLFGSGIGIYADYEDFDMKDVFDDLYKNLDTGEIFLCSTGVEDTSIFSVPNNITFYDQEHYSPYSIFFSIGIDDTIKVGEYTDFTVKATKDGQIIRDYTGTIYFLLKDEDGDYVSSDYYELPENGFYEFVESDYGKKTFKHGLKIKKSGTYVLEIYSIDGTMGMGSETIVVKGNGGSNDFEYDRWSFNPNYSDEMNEAYQYARYYDITTKDSIAEANMSDGLKRIAMAKMLANYAENVLGIDDFDTSRNCKFSDVSTSLDRQYDYGVTKACQLGIMGINTPGNKFYPNGGVTRAEFATALSRLLYGTKDGTDVYYSTHIRKLWIEGIITKTDPNLREKRGYVMLMLMRAMETYDD